MAEETSKKTKFAALLKLPLGRLICCLVFAILMSLGACLVNTAGFSVSVTHTVVDIDAMYTSEVEKNPGMAHTPRMMIGKESDGKVKAKMGAYIYKPSWVNESNPAPAICLTHGYLNSKEMQEAPAIEMARRGYVVFEYDMYDHGDSVWDTPAQFSFYAWSAYDAAQYVYTLPYVQKAADGTGMIAVSGHSMGGFSSELAAAWDELAFDTHFHAYRTISAVLAVGADFRYDDMYVAGYFPAYGIADITKTYQTYNIRTCGTIAAEYDEFFFDNSGKSTGTVTKKNYLSDSVGKAMLGITTTGEAGKFYKVNPLTNTNDETLTTGYGERVIYVPKGDHPYNTWSPEVTGNMIDFYAHAFTYQSSAHAVTLNSKVNTTLGAKHQVWWLKEVFTCLGLIAIVGAILYAVEALVKAPFFKGSVREDTVAMFDGTLALRNPAPAANAPAEEAKPEVKAEAKPVAGVKKGVGIVLTVLGAVCSFLLIPAFMDRSADEGLTKLNTWLGYGIWVLILLGVLGGVFYLYLKAKGGDEEKAKKVFGRLVIGSVVVGLTGLLLKWVITSGTTKILNSTNAWWNAPSINTIAYWAIASGLLGLLFTFITYFLTGAHERSVAEELGLKASWKQVGIGALVAIVITVGAYLMIYLSTIIFGSDFRVYTYAFKSFGSVQAFVSYLRYIPPFFIFYLCAGIGIAAISNGRKGWVADLLSIVVEAAPCALFLIYQYGVLETTGTAPYPSFALSGILVQGLIPTLIILALIQRVTLKKTGNIWTGVFLNTLFFTMITMANTTVYNLSL
jgi:pimeloyl-ACP methyl ester carboxylesterase